MIASINDDDHSDVENVETTRRRRRNRHNNPAAPRPSVPNQNSAINMLQNMNTSKTVAAMILEDSSEKKVNSINNLAPQSVAARKLLSPLQTNALNIPLNRNETIDVLKLMSNIYDNTISVVITE